MDFKDILLCTSPLALLLKLLDKPGKESEKPAESTVDRTPITPDGLPVK